MDFSKTLFLETNGGVTSALYPVSLGHKLSLHLDLGLYTPQPWLFRALLDRDYAANKPTLSYCVLCLMKICLRSKRRSNSTHYYYLPVTKSSSVSWLA